MTSTDFEVEGIRLLRRLTLIIHRGRIVQCFYPVFPPDQDVPQVVAWLTARGPRGP